MGSSDLARFVAPDRLRELAGGAAVPAHAHGTALMLDISGFTALGERYARELGERPGAEALARRLDSACEALVGTLSSHGGVVVSFSGDAMVAWFASAPDPAPAAQRALHCAQALHHASAEPLKVVVCSGWARRFVAGDPSVQRLDTLAGAMIDRLGCGEACTRAGETLVDEATCALVGDAGSCGAWRTAGDGSRFAVRATAPIDGPRAPPPPDPRAAPRLPAEQLRPWVLPAVYEGVASARNLFPLELRPIVALFVAFPGIDCDRGDDAAQRLDAVARQLQQVASNSGGSLLQLTMGEKGGYAYLCWGAPVAREAAALRALGAACEARTALQALGFLETVRLGLAAGMARAGAYGSRTRAAYGALGACTNRAARLMSLALPGQILLSEELQAGAQSAYGVAPVAGLEAKGGGALAAFELLAARAGSTSPAADAAIVGRAAESALALGLLDEARRGALRLLRISGDTGVGKTHFVADLARRAAQSGFVVAASGATPVAGNIPYAAWRGICKGLLDADDARLKDDTRRARARRAMKTLLPARIRALPLLAPMLELELPDTELTAELAPAQRAQLLQAVLAELLRAAAARQPLLLVIEDLHGVDAPSRDLMLALVPALHGAPICIATTERPMPASAASPSELATTIELKPLEDADLRALAAQRLDRDGRLDERRELLDELCRRSAGNPFYLEELAKLVLRSGWRSAAEVAWPDSLHSLILSRVDALPPAQRVLLKAASVAGRVFRREWLGALLPAAMNKPRELDALLRDLDERELIGAEAQQRSGLSFRHALTHEVIYQSVTQDQRTQLHEQLARELEQRSPVRDVHDIAHHHGLGGSVDKQREWFERAAQAALAAHANEATLAYGERLLPLLRSDDERVEVHLRQAGVLELTGRREAASAAALQAQALAGGLDVRARARCAHLLGRIHNRVDFDLARHHLDTAARLWEEAGDIEQATECLAVIVSTHLLQGHYAQAEADAQRTLETARQSRSEKVEAVAHESMAIVATYRNDRAGAHLAYRAALAGLGRHDAMRRARIYNNLAYSEFRAGRYATSGRHYARALRVADEIGFARIVRTGQLGLAASHLQLGDYASARPLLEDVVACARAARDDPTTLAQCVRDLGVCAFFEGDLDVAQAHFEESLGLARAASAEWFGFAENLAWLHVERGELDRARELLRDALQGRAPSGDLGGPVTLLVHVQLARLRGEPSAAASLLGASRRLTYKARIRALAVYEKAEMAAEMQHLRQALPTGEWRRAWRRGMAMDDAALMAFAGSLLEPVPATRSARTTVTG